MRGESGKVAGIKRQTTYPVMTKESVAAYGSYLVEQGRHERTALKYQKILMRFWDFLPEDKKLKKSAVKNWIQSQYENGLAGRTVTFNMRVINGYLGFIQHWEMQFDGRVDFEDVDTPELTRDEYMRLLRTALILEDERAYVIVKILALTGIRVGEICNVTVQALRDGYMTTEFRTSRAVSKDEVRFPLSLRMELLQYAQRWGINDGPIVTTRNGRSPDRVQIYHMLQNLGHDACVDMQKATPKSLRNLYKTTHEKIYADIRAQAEQSYEKLLERERESLGIEDYYRSHRVERAKRHHR